MDKIYEQEVEKFFLENFNTDRIFYSIERADYLILYYIKLCQEKGGNGARVYLKNLADEMNLPIPQISKAAKNLQDKGYVEWKMNEEKDRTYVELTKTAVELMEDERERMKELYTRIRREIPDAELKNFVQTVKKISIILTEES